MRSTSRKSYREFKSSKQIDTVSKKIYHCLKMHGPMSQGEVWKKLKKYLRHSVGPRFAEMNRAGLIKCVGKKACRVTGKTVLSWSAE